MLHLGKAKRCFLLFFFLFSSQSHSIAFSSSDWVVDFSGALGASFFVSSCNDGYWRVASAAPLPSCAPAASAAVYGLSDDFIPAHLSWTVYRKVSDLTVGATVTTRLPVFDFSDARVLRTMAPRDLVTQGFIFWETKSSGRFELGRNYPLFGRSLVFFNPLFLDGFHNFEAFDARHGAGVPFLHPDVVFAYETPVIKGFSFSAALGDSRGLLRMLPSYPLTVQTPSFSSRLLYQQQVARFWYAYFSQRLFYLGDVKDFRISAHEFGAAIGALEKGFSFVFNYQFGRAGGLLSDVLSTLDASSSLFPNVHHVFFGVSYHRTQTRLFAYYGETIVAEHPNLRRDGWTLAVSRAINSYLSLVGTLSVLNRHDLSQKTTPMGHLAVGFIFKF